MNTTCFRRLFLPLLILALILTLGLTACKSGKKPDPETNPAASTEGTTPDSPSENTSVPKTATYTVTVTNACGTPLSGILVTVYEGADTNQSILNGMTDANGTYTFTATKGNYQATAIRTGPASIADTAFFEPDATTLTIVLGDHPAGCSCTTDEETTAAEPNIAA